MADRAKLAVWCDLYGGLISVLQDELRLTAALATGDNIRLICDPLSREKIDRLFVHLQDEAAMLDWRVNVPLGDAVQQLHLSAVTAGERVLILATLEQDISGELFEELIRINSDQANELRAAQKELAIRSREVAEKTTHHTEEEHLDDFMRFQNEHTALQRQMARKNSELERLNKLKNHFLGIAAHDLRNPMGAISIFAQLLLNEKVGPLTDKQREIVERIAHSSTFMLGLVDDLLDISIIESGNLQLNKEPCDIAELVSEVVGLHEHYADSKHIDLTCKIEEALPDKVTIDAGKMEQVIGNLISNAVKYSSPETHTSVTLRNAEDVIELEVQDQGQGIPQEEFANLFKPFATTSVHSTGGEISTGLGLSIARRIVEGHGGGISVRSKVGEGSTFTVRLPVA